MEGELHEIKKNLNKSIKLILELEGNGENSYSFQSPQTTRLNQNLKSSQEFGILAFEKCLSQLNDIESKLKTLRGDFLTGSEDLINKEIKVIQHKNEIKRDSINKYESFINNSKVSINELNQF